jgi:MoaA/NifB/PqqE/SkfB family radical SAM enzyme
MWMTTEESSYLSTNEKIDLVTEFADMNPTGEVVLTGGEPMQKTEEFFTLLIKCRMYGLKSACNTNGSFIGEHNFRRVLTDGPDFLVISLDSHREEIHDFIRGTPGSHRHVVGIIRALTNMKAREHFTNPAKLFTNTVLFEDNIRELMDYVAFAECLNVDGVIFQLLDYTFWNQGNTDVFFKEHFFRDTNIAQHYLGRLVESLPIHPVLHTTAADLFWMQRYLVNPHQTTDHVCDSCNNNMMVDSYGNVKLCFNMPQIMSYSSIANVRDRTLREIWGSEAAASARKIMNGCRRSCGLLNCHRKKNR